MATPLETQLSKENEALCAKIREQDVIIKTLQGKVDALVQKLFGKSSEKLDERQLMLLLQGGDEGPKKSEASECESVDLEAQRKVKKSVRSEVRIPDNLPVSEHLEIIPEAVQASPDEFRYVDSQFTEQLDFQPPRYTKRIIERRRYAKIDEPQLPPIIAELPVMVAGCKAAPGLLAAIIVGKFCDHLPLYRQEQIAMQRHGLYLSRQTMSRWLADVSQQMRPVYELMHQDLLAQKYVQCDETCIKYLKPGSGKAQHGYFWVVASPGKDTVFHWHTGRSGQCFDQVIPLWYNHTLGCDAYSVYIAAQKNRQSKFRLAGCWAHVRRKFYEARNHDPRRAGLALRLIASLYKIEDRLKKLGYGPCLKAVVRQHEAAPIIARLFELLRKWTMASRFTPQSAMGKASSYTLAISMALMAYLEEGNVEIDNNRVENAIRPTAIGKKNWLFIGDESSGQNSAILYTLVEACRQRGIDPWKYFKDILTRLPTMSTRDYAKLTPAAWQAAQQNRVPVAASAALAPAIAQTKAA